MAVTQLTLVLFFGPLDQCTASRGDHREEEESCCLCPAVTMAEQFHDDKAHPPPGKGSPRERSGGSRECDTF